MALEETGVLPTGASFRGSVGSSVITSGWSECAPRTGMFADFGLGLEAWLSGKGPKEEDRALTHIGRRCVSAVSWQ